MSTYEELKQKGNDAFKLGNNEEAIKYWSDAITHVENNDKDKDLLKVLYSNRSGAHLKMKNKQKALDDAGTCITLDRSWTKGFIRKGDALHSELKYIEAYNSYNEASRIDPNDKSIKEKMETMMNLIARASDQERNQRSSFGTTTQSGNSYVQAPGFMGKIQTFLRIFIIGSFIVSMLPLSFILDRRIIALVWRGFVLSTITNNFLALVAKHGMPQFSTSYMQKLVPETSMSLMLLGTLLLTCSKMYIFGSLPLFIHEVNFFAGDIITRFADTVRQQKAQLTGILRQYMPSAANMDPEDLIRGLNKKSFLEGTGRLSAYSEVVQGIYLIIEVFLPTRNLLLVFLWWQFLKVRFLLDQTGNIRWAFGDIDRNISTALTHKMCPALVNKGYQFVKSYLEKQIKDVQQASTSRNQAQVPSTSFVERMKSSCNIM